MKKTFPYAFFCKLGASSEAGGEIMTIPITTQGSLFKIDDFVKSPISAFPFIPRHCGVL